MRLAVLVVLGAILGVVVTLAGLLVAGGYYEYRWHPNLVYDSSWPPTCTSLERVAMAQDGWEQVPGQPDACYVRRPRLRLN